MKRCRVKIKLDKALIERSVQMGGQKGVFDALDHLKSVSQDQVPLDQGPLKASASVDVSADGTSGTVSYDTPYAVVQHENTWYSHQRGRKAKYLEDPVNDPSVQNEMVQLLGGGLKSELGG
ncbi:MAG: hypothetical protein IKK34_08050 [Clostridia bacterium]|nr:hypothetical protein [Clostridia bacterium]